MYYQLLWLAIVLHAFVNFYNANDVLLTINNYMEHFFFLDSTLGGAVIT
ncbi:hypothetical protein Ark11_0341 [Candidatus Ichthyocystis hellenicum]|uniref:Uncharacterized protein n=1 Tax=Candidatus Ichthyocystis hellenicum TaxID=1561003 RepID=A0A0S4M1N7_9BURK|nr:hypothetical protein Ark11_0341 [Candidatus Ichthyocystis hellenicum]